MGIEWKEGAVCFADGAQWFLQESDTFVNNKGGFMCADDLVEFSDFQLNTIKKGDYISAVNISNKRTFDKMVEVFGLFGYEFKHSADAVFYSIRSEQCIYAADDGLMFYGSKNGKRRELLANQVEAIGELKRLEIKRDNRDAEDMFVDKPTEWTDKHYDFNYQLTKEDIEKGHVRVDAYFVNRMWKINQWDDTGAAFHVLKTLPRIANNKNPLKRELVALKKQFDLLCKMHGADDEDLK